MAAYPRGDYFAAIGGRNRSGATVVFTMSERDEQLLCERTYCESAFRSEGNLLSEKDQMLSDIDRFLSLPPEERLLFAVGRRFNVFFFLDDLKKSELRSQARLYMDEIKRKIPMWILHSCAIMYDSPRYKEIRHSLMRLHLLCRILYFLMDGQQGSCTSSPSR